MKKIGDSFKGVVFGIILIIIGVVLLWWNEGNNVKNLKSKLKAAGMTCGLLMLSVCDYTSSRITSIAASPLRSPTLMILV